MAEENNDYEEKDWYDNPKNTDIYNNNTDRDWYDNVPDSRYQSIFSTSAIAKKVSDHGHLCAPGQCPTSEDISNHSPDRPNRKVNAFIKLLIQRGLLT